MHPGRRRATTEQDDRSERQRHPALPADVVLRLVEAVSVELVNQVPPLRADADAAQAVFDSRAEVAGELGPGAVRLELMDADRAQSAEYIWRNRGRPGLERIPQHHIGVVGELVEPPPAGEGGAAQAILRPTAGRADAQVVGEPRRRVDGRGPADPPVGSAGVVQIRRARQTAERAADRHAARAGTPDAADE